MPHNIPDAVNPQPIVQIQNRINSLPNHNIIREFLMKLEYKEQGLQFNDIPDSPPDSLNEPEPQMQDGIENRNICMICRTLYYDTVWSCIGVQ